MIDPFTYWSRVAAALSVTERTGRQLIETTAASGKVVAARTRQSSSESWVTGSRANHEAGRMIPEKLSAAAASGQALTNAWWKAQVELTNQSARTIRMMTRGRPPTMNEAAEFWSTAAMSALLLFEGAAAMGRDALRPYHQATTRNARRLHAA